MEVVYLSDGTLNPARGVRGGLDGGAAQQRKRFRDGTVSDELGSYARVVLSPGKRSSRFHAEEAATGRPTSATPC